MRMIAALVFLSVGLLWSGQPASAQGELVIHISLLRLLTSPIELPEEGVRVVIVGYLQEEVNLHLYPTVDLAESEDFVSSILVSYDENLEIGSSSCLSRFVRIHGRLAHERPDGDSLIVYEIERIEDSKTGEICWAAAQ